MGCGESKHAVATENTLTKSKSKNIESKSINNGKEKESEIPDEIKAVQSQPDDEKKIENDEEEKVILRNREENDEGKEIDAAVVGVEEKKEEIKNQELEGVSGKLDPKEKDGENYTNKEKGKEVVGPAEETKSSGEEKTPDQNENGNAEAPTADEKAN